MSAHKGGFTGLTTILSQFLQKLKDKLRPHTPVVTTVRVTSGQSSPLTIAVNTPTPLHADVRDQDNHTMPSVAVSWASSNLSIAQITLPSAQQAYVTGLTNGSVSVTVTAGAITSAALPITVITPVPPPTQSKIIGLSGSLAFGSALVGATPTLTLRISNTGNASLSVTSLTYPTGFSGAFAGLVGSQSFQDVTVTFTPVAATTYSGTVTVNCDATSGTNTTTASGTGTVATTRIISLSGSLVFGSIPIGSPSTRTLTITNTGSATLTVSSITYPSGFTGAFAGTIASNASQNVSVTFTPVAATTYSGTVTVASDKTSGTNTTTASGTGTQPQPPAGNVLSPSNIRYLGCIRMPNSGTDTTFTYGGMSGRKVGIQTRLFVTGNVVASGVNPPDVYELDITGLTPNTTPSAAPRATLVTNWGNIYHGKRQSWSSVSPFAEQDLTGLNAINHGLYWHDGLQQLFWGYAFNYVTTAPWSVGFSTLDNPNTGASTAYGPFKFSATDSQGTHLGGRAQWFAIHPTTGKMLMGGITKSGEADLSKGPSLYGDPDWPTPSTTSGQNMSAIVQGGKYLTYYHQGYDSLGTPASPLKTFQYDGTLTYIFEYGPAQSTTRIDPTLNSGRGTWSSDDSTEGAFWFEGVNRRGVLFFCTLMAGYGTSSSDPTACHEWYANIGNLGVNLSGTVGTFTGGETLTGGTSGHHATVQSYDVTTHAIWGIQNGNQGDFTVGETVTGGISGAHGVVTYFRRNAPNCAHGFAPALTGITGPVTTKSVPTIIIYDPAKLEAVKAGTATDYAQSADYIVDVEATYGVVTAPQNSPGAAKSFAGYYFDPATNRLYLNANKADIFRVGPQFAETLIHVFEILDT